MLTYIHIYARTANLEFVHFW